MPHDARSMTLQIATDAHLRGLALAARSAQMPRRRAAGPRRRWLWPVLGRIARLAGGGRPC